MKSSRLKKIIVFAIGLVSSLAITSIAARAKKSHDAHECACDDADCNCEGKYMHVHIPEPSVRKVPKVKKLGKREAPAGKSGSTRTAEAVQSIFEDIKEKSLPNDSIAKIIISLINLQNAVNPSEAIDVRNIHFMKYKEQNTMVIDLYTSNHGKPGYEEELSHLWRDVFLAEDFWNADFVKVRVSVKEKKTGHSLETVSCGLDDIRRYLLKETTIDEFKASWSRKKARTEKNESSKGKKVRKLAGHNS